MSRPYYVNGIVYSKINPERGRGTIKTIEQHAPKIVTVEWEDGTTQLYYTRDLTRTTLEERRKNARTRYWTGGRTVTKRITLTDAQRLRFKDLARESYNAIAYDCWGERIPSKADFVDVIAQQMFDGATNARNKMTTAERELWQSLPGQTQRKIMLEAL